MVMELCLTLNNMHMYIWVRGQSTNVYYFVYMKWGYYDICVNEKLAISGSGQDQSGITPDQCKYQPMTTARVSGTPEGHGYVCGTVASAPLLRGTVETDNVIHKLYPTLNITTTQSDM